MKTPDLREAGLLRQLYEALLGPVEEHLGGAEELLIVPHKWLFEVPWAALVAADGRYLVERFVIRVAPSVRVAWQAAERVRQRAPGQRGHVVVVGNPWPTAEGFAPLPHAEAEAVEVEEMLNKAGVMVRDFYKADRNPRATRSAVKKSLQDSDWSHLALHANKDEHALVLARGKQVHFRVHYLHSHTCASGLCKQHSVGLWSGLLCSGRYKQHWMFNAVRR